MRNNPTNLIDPNGENAASAALNQAAGVIGNIPHPVAKVASLALEGLAISIVVVETVDSGREQYVRQLETSKDVSGAATGTIIGTAIGVIGRTVTLAKSITNPFEGTPGSVVSSDTHDGKPKQDRRYGPDGFPETDVDSDHDHGQGRPHAHDWGRPPDGKSPTNADRGPGRPLKPGDPKSQQKPQNAPKQPKSTKTPQQQKPAAPAKQP